MASVELRTLGDCRIMLGGNELGPQSPNAFGLALYLCVERGRPHSRDELLPLFFPGSPPSNAAHSLRQNVYKLRGLGLPCTTEQSGTVVPAASVRDDYSALLASGELPDRSRATAPGGFLPGYWPALSDGFTAWLEAQRDAVHGALRRAYVARIAERRAVARWDQVETVARACLEIDPLNEEATLALAESLALSGSKAAGMRVLEQYIGEVGSTDAALVIPADILRRRISERLATARPRYLEPPMIGREAELRTLGGTLAEAQAGLPAAVHIWGEAGIGKTRLIREFLNVMQLSSARVVEVASQPHDLGRPMSVLVDMVPQLLRLPGVLGADPSSVSLLRSLVTIAADDGAGPPAARAASPEELLSTITDALSDALDAVAGNRLLVIVMEDLHWADAPSRRILANIVAERKRRHVLLLASSREREGLSVHGMTELAIGGLPRDASSQFVQRQLADRVATPEPGVAERILALSGGNPFYLRSLCDYYADTGALEATPPRLRDLVLQRVRALPTPSRTVLAMCALLGKRATVARLQQALAMPTHALASALADLETSGLVQPRETELQMQHALLTAALLEDLPKSELLLLRRALAACLEEESRTTEEIGLLWDAADHWAACGEPAKAKELFRSCCLHAAKVGAAMECADSFAKYASYADEAEATALLGTVCGQIRLSAAWTQWFLQRPNLNRLLSERTTFSHSIHLALLDLGHRYSPQSALHIDKLIQAAENHSASTSVRLSAASIGMAVAEDRDDEALARRLADAIHLEGLSTLDELDPHGIRVQLIYHGHFGSRETGLRVVNSVLALPDKRITSGESLRTLINAGIYLINAGHLNEADDALQRAMRLSPSASAHRSLITAYQGLIARHLGKDVKVYVDALLKTVPADALQELDSMALYLLARHAMDVNDLTTAASAIGVLHSRIVMTSMEAHWAAQTALETRLAAMELTAIDPKVLADLAGWSLRTAPRRAEDDVALSVGLALQLTDPADSISFLDAYLRSRRDGVPVLPLLCSLRERLIEIAN